MEGDRTFQTAGVQYSVSSARISNGTTQPYGSGVSVAYVAGNDSYRLTAPDGSTMTFLPSDLQSPQAGSSSLVYVKVNGTTRDQFTLTVPSSLGVQLSYTLLGAWLRTNTTDNTSVGRIAVGGSPTLTSDVPKSGTASYTANTGGTANLSGTGYTLSGNSAATFSANFGAGTIATSLTLAGTPLPVGSTVTSFGTFTGSGTLTSGGPGFTGTLSGSNATGLFSGLFFGPQAVEMGYSWYLNGATFSAVGVAFGTKN